MSPLENRETANQKLIEAARQKREIQEQEELRKTLVKSGHIQDNEGLERARSSSPVRLPLKELPLPTHQFTYPLSNEQLSSLISGDIVDNFSLSSVIAELNDQEPAWQDSIGRSTAKRWAESESCQLIVENSDESAHRVRVQVALPGFHGRSATEIWGRGNETIVVELAFSDLQSGFSRWRNKLGF